MKGFGPIKVFANERQLVRREGFGVIGTALVSPVVRSGKVCGSNSFVAVCVKKRVKKFQDGLGCAVSQSRAENERAPPGGYKEGLRECETVGI
jgi:hypothetical protein